MKKKILLLFSLFLVFLLIACNGGTNTSAMPEETENTVPEETEENSNDDGSTTTANIEKASLNTSNKVEFTVDSDYDEGTIGYESDKLRAKQKAIEEQAPEEYQDFLFILNSLNSLWAPYVSSLDNDDKSIDEKKAVLIEIKSAIAEAETIKERLDIVEVTINNVEEYEQLKATITSVLSMETYLIDYADILTAE